MITRETRRRQKAKRLSKHEKKGDLSEFRTPKGRRRWKGNSGKRREKKHERQEKAVLSQVERERAEAPLGDREKEKEWKRRSSAEVRIFFSRSVPILAHTPALLYIYKCFRPFKKDVLFVLLVASRGYCLCVVSTDGMERHQRMHPPRVAFLFFGAERDRL